MLFSVEITGAIMVDTLSPNVHVAGSDDLDGLPIVAEKMFADHNGVHKPRIEKKQRKLARKLSFLKELLEEGEQLLAVTTAVSPTSFLEQWTTGFIFVYIKRCLLVFTDRRIFHIPTRMDYDYRGSIAQIRYGDLESIAQKGSRLKIAYKSGTKDQFLYVNRSERKKIRALLQSVNLQGSTSVARTRVHLCPKCTSELETDRFECPNCGLEFKNRKRALKLSLLLPGGGYFYTGHSFLGIADAAVELFFLIAIVVSLIPNAIFPNGNFAFAGLLALLLIIEKMITVYHANHFVKEFLPTDESPTRDGPLKTGLKWAGLAVVLLFVAASFFGILMDTGIVPSDRVLGPDDIPESHYQELSAAGIIETGEVIEFFYSEGLISIREGGSILTDQRVIAYQEGDDDLVTTYYIWNEEIASVELAQPGDSLNFSVYVVSAHDEEVWLELWLPHEYGDAERFAAAVEAKIGD
jgi:hypothetical protein